MARSAFTSAARYAAYTHHGRTGVRPRRLRGRLAVLLALGALSPGGVLVAQERTPIASGRCPSAAREEAVLMARGGGSAEAAGLLDRMSGHAPGDRACRADLVAVLSWAGRHAEALDAGKGLAPSELDPVVLEAMGRSARERGRPEIAARHYRAAAGKDPGRVEAQVGLMLSLLEAGEPFAAERRIASLPAAHRKEPGALVASARVLRAVGRLAEAGRLVAEALAVDPAHADALRLREDLRVDGIWELSAAAGLGRSTGGELGTRDRALRTRIVSPRVGDRVRLFAVTRRSDADFDAGLGLHERIGGGLILGSRRAAFTVEVSEELARGSGPALGGALDFRGDHWSLGLSGSTGSEEVPLRATLLGLDGWGASAGLGYRAGDRWGWRAHAAVLRISDGNRRASVYTALERRLARGPRDRLAATLELWAARSSRSDVAYFSPSEVVSPSLSVAWERVLWRTTSADLRQHVSVTGGVVDQAGYGRAASFLVGYGHDWTLTRYFGLGYEVGWGRPVYDGVRERRVQGRVSVVWRLP